MKQRLIYSFLILLTHCLSFPGLLKSQSNIIDGFYDQAVVDNLTLPVGIRFDENGIGFLWEKSGKVYIIDSETEEKSLMLDISDEVGSWGDHGLTGLALDPEFADNGIIYFAYSVDRYFLYNSELSSYNPDSSILTNATIGRITRYTVDNSNYPYQIIDGSRKIVLGHDHLDGLPILADFHGVGSLVFGNDGSLLISCGDGGLDNEPNVTYHTDQALKDGIIDSTEVLGSYRSQSIHSLNGKVLRINPQNGEGLQGNPFYDPQNPRSNASRVWALGFRNPYKFIYVPGTGAHNIDLDDPGKFIVGDVGSSYWEEFNILSKKAQNFGWPIYEGHDKVWPYGFYETENPFARNPLYDGNGCSKEYLRFQDLISQDNEAKQKIILNPCSDSEDDIPENIPTFIHQRPLIYYNNISWNKPTRSYLPGYDSNGEAIQIGVDELSKNFGEIFDGHSALPGDFHLEGVLPDTFQNTILVSDFSGWIKAFHVDENLALTKISDIRSDIKGVVDISLNRSDQCIYYVNILTNELRKICFGGNPPPVAIALSDTLYGGSELMVKFDASNSFDPNQIDLSYNWDFGDGESSTKPNVSHLYKSSSSVPQKFEAVLTVTDSLGKYDTDTLLISLNNTPPKVSIVSPIRDSYYAVNGYNRLDFKAEVSDNEEQIGNLKYTWQVHLHHNSHYHSEEPVHDNEFSALIEPIGCVERDVYWYRVNIEVEDSYGLKGADELLLQPNCEEYGVIEWLKYDAMGYDIDLNWKNLSVSNVDRFIVQKISNSGRITDLGTVEKQISDGYTFTDANPIDGDNRYRLKIYSSSGNYHYSTEFIARFPVYDVVHIYPNPVIYNSITVEIDQPGPEEIKAEAFTLDGKKLLEKEIYNSNTNLVSAHLNLPELVPGFYVLKVSIGNEIFLKKFEVVRF